jgi:hypothetical protein
MDDLCEFGHPKSSHDYAWCEGVCMDGVNIGDRHVVCDCEEFKRG